MGISNRYAGIDEYAIQLIQYKAKRLIGTAGFTKSDQEDIEQDLVLDLIQRLPSFNPNKAQRKTFIARLVEHKVASILEARSAKLRDYRLCDCSLNDIFESDEGDCIERSDTIDQDDYFLRIGVQARPSINQSDFEFDVKQALEKLPCDLQKLCRLLTEYSITEISRSTGIPRGTLYESINKLRKIFNDNGLSEYL